MSEAIKAKRKELRQSIGKLINAVGELIYTIAVISTMYQVWFVILPNIK